MVVKKGGPRRGVEFMSNLEHRSESAVGEHVLYLLGYLRRYFAIEVL